MGNRRLGSQETGNRKMGNRRMTRGQRAAGIAARVAVALVFAVNVQCAASFVLWPEAFAGGFELAGVPGAAAVRGLGVAFLMWNATYPPVIANPRRFRALFAVVLRPLAWQASRGFCCRSPSAMRRSQPPSSGS